MNRTFRTFERSIILTFVDREQMELFVDTIQDQLRYVEVLMTGIPKRMKVTLRGEKEAVKQASRTIKWLQKSIHGISNMDEHGQFRWDLSYFKRMISGVAPELVLDALRYMGYGVEIHDHYFLSTASVDVIQDLAFSIKQIWTELSQRIRSKALKRVLTLVSVIRNENPSEIYTEGVEGGVISEKEIRLIVNPEQALKILMKPVLSS